MISKIRNLFQKIKANREARLWPEREIIVEFNDNQLSASYPNGDKLTVNLGNLQVVKIITNDSGPWGADVWYSFSSAESRCSFPQGATGEKEATQYLFSLSGFDESNFIKAMGSTSNSEFVCWEK